MIPDSVTSIGHWAFSGCSSLTSIVIPDSVTSIGQHAFYHCNALASITVNANNPNYKSSDGNLYTKDGKTLIQYAVGKTDKTFTVPDGVTSIGDRAFDSCTALKDIYYAGTAEEWSKIEIDNSYGCNDYLLNATIHYNYVPEE